MKKLLPYIALIGAALPTVSSADSLATTSQSRFMLYMRVPVSLSDRTFTAPRFGLSFERSVPYSASNPHYTLNSGPLFGLRPHVSLIDLQFNAPRAQMLRLGGASMLSSDGEKSVWKSPWLWVGIGVAALGISCATDNFPCDDGGNGSGGGGGGY